MKRILYLPIVAITTLIAVACSSTKEEAAEPVKEPTIMFGIIADDYNISRKKVESGESWSKILDGYGIGARKVVRLEELTKDICPLRQIRAGNHYTTFTRQDSLATHLDHLVYEKNLVDYVVFSFVGDSVAVREGKRDVTIKRKKSTAVIKNSLWGAIMAEKLPYALAAEVEDIYEWTIDFFGIQANDSFTVIYDEKFIDTLSVGVGRVWGVKFVHRGKEIYAIPYETDGKVKYWEKDGTSLRKQVLKAPLKFTRISSGFTNARLHPVLKVYRPHHGVDYSAPAGTPVRTIADGTIIQLGYRGAAGNMIKIKHPGNLTTGYLHLKGYAKGLKVGSRVSQGQVIGYVGSTGRSTGPHLDFRVWKGSTPINPLNIPQTPSEPIAKAHREKFEKVRVRIMAELNGDVPDSMKVTNLKDFQ
jgi:murein DD-endopeptidase MepM/ murein hydrolase activator NlpD